MSEVIESTQDTQLDTKQNTQQDTKQNTQFDTQLDTKQNAQFDTQLGIKHNMESSVEFELLTDETNNQSDIQPSSACNMSHINKPKLTPDMFKVIDIEYKEKYKQCTGDPIMNQLSHNEQLNVYAKIITFWIKEYRQFDTEQKYGLDMFKEKITKYANDPILFARYYYVRNMYDNIYFGLKKQFSEYDFNKILTISKKSLDGSTIPAICNDTKIDNLTAKQKKKKAYRIKCKNKTKHEQNISVE